MIIKRVETANYIYETEAMLVEETRFFLVGIDKEGKCHRDCTAYTTYDEALAAIPFTKRLWGLEVITIESKISRHTEIIKHRKKKRS